MSKKNNLSIYLTYLLRHNPYDADLDMDKKGFVSTQQLIQNINKIGKYEINIEKLEEIVCKDSKERFKFNEDKTKIKACQGHSLDFVEPELQFEEPPMFLYHGTNTDALELIKNSGEINKMERHAVHMQDNFDKAWNSAVRWKKTPVVLRIDTEKLMKNGIVLGKTENNVWCADYVPISCIVEEIYQKYYDLDER